MSRPREHKFSYNFQNCIIPLCSCGMDIESTSHFFLPYSMATSKTWTWTLDPDPEPGSWTLDPEPGPWFLDPGPLTRTLDPEHGPWTRTLDPDPVKSGP